MAAFQFTPGPISLFARFRNNSTAQYLGTATVAPEPEGEKFKIPIMNDLSGRSVPFQLVQDGEKHRIFVTMNRFDISVYQTIRALESGGLVGGTELGSESGLARGTLVIGVSDWELILINNYFNTVAAGGVGLTFGRRYFSSNLRQYKESTAGTRVLELALAIECENVFDPITRGFRLYTELLSEIGTLGPVT